MSLVEDVEKDLAADKGTGAESIYVVKLVPWNQQGQLPNFRASRVDDRGKLVEFFERHAGRDYAEVWYCRTQIDTSIFSVAGRIAFVRGSAEVGQVIEQVWRCSPRMIEEFNGLFPFGYVRGVRVDWGYNARIQHLHVPISSALSESVVRREFGFSVQRLEQMRERLELFCAFLDEQRFAAYSIEYKIVGSKLEIIDWDTPNDRQVLAHRPALEHQGRSE
ncbi:MAG: hypothetical protein ACHQ9S_14510 [Candidatus Binatia bacterium]